VIEPVVEFRRRVWGEGKGRAKEWEMKYRGEKNI
jgi:hypothetical protein